MPELDQVVFPFALKGVKNPCTYAQADEFAAKLLKDKGTDELMRKQAWLIRLEVARFKKHIREVIERYDV